MAASTTLMTFMVRTPSNTRSVQLYGSWDNFSAPYPMKRDLRLGREHWSGCHSFENIICDGRVDELVTSRNGGLKMGGTYWYYYKLDDEIEFHNSAEPSTTRCPLLPGQLINELEVPVALSGNRRRDASVSSTSSERRTLNPEAKFVNPQPVPAPPTLLRLNTSPKLPQTLVSDARDSYSGSLSAEPEIEMTRDEDFVAAPSRIFHLPRKPSLDALLKANLKKQHPASLRPAFEAPAYSSSHPDKYQDIIDWIPDEPKHVQRLDGAEVNPEELVQRPPTRSFKGGLLLRSNSDEVVTLASFSAHRRQRSRSRSSERPARNSMITEEPPQLDLSLRHAVPQAPLSTLIEVNTPDRTPAYGPLTGRRITLEALEGRADSITTFESHLPAWPSTPPNCLQPALERTSPDGLCPGFAEFNSRFSSTTIDTTSHLGSMIIDHKYKNQILNLTAAAGSSCIPESTIEDGTSDSSEDIAEGHLDLLLQPLSSHTSLMDELAGCDDYFQPRVASSGVSYTTIDSTISTTPTTSCGESEGFKSENTSHVTTIRSSGEPYNHFQHYSLPEVENASAVTLKHFNSAKCTLVEADREPKPHRADLAHSETMQQLLDELSYLSAMIQQ